MSGSRFATSLLLLLLESGLPACCSPGATLYCASNKGFTVRRFVRGVETDYYHHYAKPVLQDTEGKDEFASVCLKLCARYCPSLDVGCEFEVKPVSVLA